MAWPQQLLQAALAHGVAGGLQHAVVHCSVGRRLQDGRLEVVHLRGRGMRLAFGGTSARRPVAILKKRPICANACTNKEKGLNASYIAEHLPVFFPQAIFPN